VQPLPLNDKTVICLSSSGNVISSKSEFYDWTYPPRRKPQVNEERREIKLKATFAIAILLAFSLAGCASLTNRMGDVETVSLVNTSSPVSVRTAFIEDAADKSAAPKQLDSLFEIDIAPQNTFGYLAVPDISQIESVDLPTKDATLWNRLANDQLNFYSKDSLMTLGVVFGSGAIAANTDIDSQIQRHFQSSIQGASSREWFDYLHANKELGNGVYTLPIMGAACLANAKNIC